ncbi:choice-of-anchor X domain-containing protein [Pleionea sp. CnH1-48]|uniref:choice-of-anchor X domain-containing protein n=1 Tax=Pleionea sp. CnH1-48 TaxID=2954494 RepID=UPI0020972D29|nr:choice-of-anchor X domain-containing protein [Pleionea sp. CnH1-48]MCO7227488.1 hypothetical protein [Pleionea sp. CnH1-48]
MNIKNIKMNKQCLWVGTAICMQFGISNPVVASEAKQLSVAPESIHHQSLKTAAESGVFSHSVMLPVGERAQHSAKTTNGQSAWTQELIIDSNQANPILFLSPDAQHWQLSFKSPQGKTVMSESMKQGSRMAVKQFEVGDQQFAGKQYQRPEASAGRWLVDFNQVAEPVAQAPVGDKYRRSQINNGGKQSRPGQSMVPSIPRGYLLAKGDPSYKLYTYLDNKVTTLDSDLNMVAYMVDSVKSNNVRSKMVKQQPGGANITRAQVRVEYPNGKVTYIAMNDQGLQGDKIAGDGRFTAKMPSVMTGTYSTQVQVQGVRNDGMAFSRSAMDLYPIEKQSYGLTSSPATLLQESLHRSLIQLDLAVMDKTAGEIFAAAEVWGTDAQGQKQAAAWVGGVVEPLAEGKAQLGFDLRWLDRSGLNAPFELRNIRLQTTHNNTPIALMKQLPLQTGKGWLSARQSKLAANGSLQKAAVINDEMLMGVRSEKVMSKVTSMTQQAASSGKLMLVHGYCSSGEPWNTSHFSNTITFKDLKKNRSHDAFAKLIRDFGASHPSFGVVAHSQGGAAALHLYTRYWSGLDYASGGRLIQSVGTPYQGTALAGNLAALGAIFGAGCGKNTDLTYSGASNWLATIPSWARQQVDYYTTSFKDRWWAYDYCNVVTDVLLDDPDDGTTEKWSGQLSGANNKGHKTGQCHTTGMRDTAQYKDSGRNATMNANAAR